MFVNAARVIRPFAFHYGFNHFKGFVYNTRVLQRLRDVRIIIIMESRDMVVMTMRTVGSTLGGTCKETATLPLLLLLRPLPLPRFKVKLPCD